MARKKKSSQRMSEPGDTEYSVEQSLEDTGSQTSVNEGAETPEPSGEPESSVTPVWDLQEDPPEKRATDVSPAPSEKAAAERSDTVASMPAVKQEVPTQNAEAPKDAPRPSRRSPRGTPAAPRERAPQRMAIPVEESTERSALRPEGHRPVPPPAREGDTLRIRSVAGGERKPFGRTLRPKPRGPQRLSEPSKAAAPPRFGFWSFTFGFFGLVFRMVVVTLLVFALVGFLSYEAVRQYVKTDPVIVPDVRGVPVAEAFDRLSEKKLGMVKEKSEASGLVAPGEIINQDPQAGTKSKVGSTVRVTISSGRANFVVPNVVNESRENAENRIRGARLEVGNVTYIEDDKVQRDIVINQNPEPGKGLDQTTKVDLLISSGSKGSSFTMPDVVGRPVTEAKAALARLGVINIETDPPGASAEVVVSQDPLVGKTIVQSQTVRLTVRRQ